jgi:hypothetical protein
MRPGAKSIQHGDAHAERFGEVARTPLRAAGELLDFADDEDGTRHRWEEGALRVPRVTGSGRLRRTRTRTACVPSAASGSHRGVTVRAGGDVRPAKDRRAAHYHGGRSFFSFTICRLRPTFQTPSPPNQAMIGRGRVIAAPPNLRNRIQTPRTHYCAFRLHLRSGETVFVVKFDDRIRRFRRGTVTCSWRSAAAASSPSINSAAQCSPISPRSASANGCMRSPRRDGCTSGRCLADRRPPALCDSDPALSRLRAGCTPRREHRARE